MNHRMARMCLLLAVLPSTGVLAADRDVTFAGEHVLEVGMDASFSALPLGFGPVGKGEWRTSVDAGASFLDANLFEASGGVFSVGVSYGVGDRWSVVGLGLLADYDVSGSAGTDELKPLFVTTPPIDLPRPVALSAATGTSRHQGLGLAVARRRERGSAKDRRWTWTAGAILDELKATGFAVDYEVLEGADAGTVGVLDLSSSYRFVTPFVDLRYERPWGRHFLLRSSVSVGMPLPRRGTVGRLAGVRPDGTAFDLSGDTDEASGHANFGDPFLAAGLAVEHRPSRLSVDLGGLAYQAVYQPLIHDGTENVLLLHFGWHSRGRGAE